MKNKLLQMGLRLFFLYLAKEAYRAQRETVSHAIYHMGSADDAKFRKAWAKLVKVSSSQELCNMNTRRLYDACWGTGVIDFLNGVHGTTAPAKDWKPVWDSMFKDMFFRACMTTTGASSIVINSVDWQHGLLEYTIRHRDCRDDSGSRKERIGKAFQRIKRWVDKKPDDFTYWHANLQVDRVLSKDHLYSHLHDWQREFENRKCFTYHWSITTDPAEVFRMSYGRGWTSCMRPGGCAGKGLLADLEAGTACMFFYLHTNLEKPIGRVVIRPAVRPSNGQPILIMSPKLYGTGTMVTAEELHNAILQQRGIDIEIRERAPLSDYHAAHRDIFDDASSYDGEQSLEEMHKALEHLQHGFSQWAPINLQFVPPSAKKLMELGKRYSCIVDHEKQKKRLQDQEERLSWHIRKLGRLMERIEYKARRMERKALVAKYQLEIKLIKSWSGIDLAIEGTGLNAWYQSGYTMVREESSIRDIYNNLIHLPKSIILERKGDECTIHLDADTKLYFPTDHLNKLLGPASYDGDGLLTVMQENFSRWVNVDFALKESVRQQIAKELSSPRCDADIDWSHIEALIERSPYQMHPRPVRALVREGVLEGMAQARDAEKDNALKRMSRTTHIAEFQTHTLVKLGAIIPPQLRIRLSQYHDEGRYWEDWTTFRDELPF